MGKNKNKPREPAGDEDEAVVDVDLKTVLAMEPDDRAVWLSKACKRAADGSLRIAKVYDVLASEKIVDGLTEKTGRRMLNTLRKYLHIFSDKQQKYLNQSAVALFFEAKRKRNAEESRGGFEEEEPRGSKIRVPRSTDPGAADKMEEMMARCRDFVRAQASGYEDRMKEVAEAEEEEKKQAAIKQLAWEWEQIENWHKQFEEWEKLQMFSNDFLAQQRAVEAEVAKQQENEKRRAEEEKIRAESEERRRQEEKRREEDRLMVELINGRNRQDGRQAKRSPSKPRDSRYRDEYGHRSDDRSRGNDRHHDDRDRGRSDRREDYSRDDSNNDRRRKAENAQSLSEIDRAATAAADMLRRREAMPSSSGFGGPGPGGGGSTLSNLLRGGSAGQGELL